MSNISDNLRDFLERPQDIKNWDEKQKQKFYLTLSVILRFQDNNEKILAAIKEFREEIIKQISNINICNNPYRTKGLYEYPEFNLHFSLISLLEYSIPDGEDFKGFRELRTADVNYQNVIKEVDKYLLENLKLNLPAEIKADLRWIASGNKQIPLHSVSLQVFPDSLFIKKLKKIESDLKNINYNIKPENVRFGLKAYPGKNKRRFPVNTLRFIKCSLSEETKIKVKNIVETINREHDHKPLFTLGITRLSLVESDPFLFNDNPEVKHYSLK